jgi:membrane-bound lytic murein transglycosylase MltF
LIEKVGVGLAFLSIERLGRALVACVAVLCLIVAAPSRATEPAASEVQDSRGLPHFATETGDLDVLLARHRIRILVPNSKTLFFVDRGRQYGTVAELGHALEDWINRTRKKQGPRIAVAFVPVARDRLLPALIAGQGDIAAANLTITDKRLVDVDFTTPWMTNVNEVIVSGPTAPRLTSLDDLAGAKLYVRLSSSYATHLSLLNEKLAARGLERFTIIPGDENLEDEDLMEMVSAGLLPMVVVDDHKATLWVRIFPNLTLRSDLVVSSAGEIAWAVRKQSPKLVAMLNSFFETHRQDTPFGNTLKHDYFTSTTIITNAYSEESVRRFKTLLDLFRRYGEKYGFDYLMIAAQGYQESRLDQTKRSPRGAVGIMQVMPATAADPAIAIKHIDIDADRNVEAGVKYLRLLIDTYLPDPAIDAKNRTLMGFAAYNAGRGNLLKFRHAATANGLDPNVWFDNVEYGAARVVGRETVQYVSNIYKYYIAYDMLEERETAAVGARRKANP